MNGKLSLVLFIAFAAAVTGILLLDNTRAGAETSIQNPPPAPPEPSDDAQVYQRSYELEADGDYQGALDAMHGLSRRRRDDYMATLRFAWLYYCVENYDESEDQYRRCMQMQSGAVEPKLGLTLPLLAQEEWNELIDVCEDILEDAPANYTAIYRLGWAQLYNTRYRDAERTFVRMLELYPSDLDARVNLGWALLHQRKTRDAERVFNEVLEYSPENTSAQQGLESLR